MSLEVAHKIVETTSESIATGRSTREKVENTLTQELIIGICSPIGTLKNEVINVLISTLKKYDYEYEVIKLSTFIDEYYPINETLKVGISKEFSRIIQKIENGNQLRRDYNDYSILAEMAIRKIVIDRFGEDIDLSKIPPIEALKSRRKCYIIDSIKNLEELRLLRSVYREIFYMFSIFSPLKEREEYLIHKKHLSVPDTRKIIQTDEYENNEAGQNVRDTFVNGDFFVRVSESNKSKITPKIERYFHLIFDSEVITPMPGEVAMYQAKSAAGNSACLSRQVGATITDKSGEVISSGWNDVPKFGGNLYMEGNFVDNRCTKTGVCSNDIQKDALTNDIIRYLLEDKELKADLFQQKEFNLESEPVKRLIYIIRKSTKIKDLIEFSRSVHAEMHAIINGCQLSGAKMKGGKLYCTTYPCHNCARHIIVAGIQEVYYIEPYVKSLCMELHADALTEDENTEGKVKILVYDGVAPRRYLEFFTMFKERKTNGKKNNPILKTVKPKTQLTLQALPTLEIQAIMSLNESKLKILKNEKI